jgi:hypothetical protein
MQSAGARFVRTPCVFYCRAGSVPTPRLSRIRSPVTARTETRPINSHLVHVIELEVYGTR